MLKFKYLTYLLAGLMVFTAPACELAETNIDPTRVADVDLRLILPAAITQTAYNQSANQARIPGIVMQQFIGFDAQQVAYTTYNIPEDVFNNYWRTGLYAGSLKDCKVLIDKAQAEGQPHYEGIAKIMMAENYATATSMFGDLPFSQALLGTENLKPAYDTQEQVYAGIQSLLDDAIGLLGSASVPGGPGSDDLIFGGDASLWVKTAYALKARYHMHLTRRNGASAATSALAALENAFKTADEQPAFAWDVALTANNPIAKFGIGRPNTLVIDSTFSKLMTNTADPRQDFYMSFNGAEWDFFNSSNANLVWAQSNSVIPIISLAELLFIKAEAQLMTGESDATVSATLAEAITASMDLVGVDPANYATYVADHSDFTGLSTADEKLQLIIEEAYVAYYGIGFIQTWTNYRRTGYPNLTSRNNAPGLNPSGVVPVRFLYPVSEAQTNSANLDAAKARQGGALLDAKLWAFQ